MTLPIFPTSPVPASMSRRPNWNQSRVTYDSGHRQSSTPWSKPLYNYAFDLQNIPRSKQSSLETFVNSLKMSAAFLFMDPYDNRANGVVVVNTGTSPSSFMLVNANGWPYIPVSGDLLITSNVDGARTRGTHYSYDDETGVFSVHSTISSGDFWVASGGLFRKCMMDEYSLSSKLWENFNGTISFTEVAIP